MAVTRSTAADRRQRETETAPRRQPGFPVQGLPGDPAGTARNLEGLLLAAAAAVVLLGLALAYLAMVKPLEGDPAEIAAGRIVNLNDLRGADQLLGALDVFPSSAERSYAAQAIWKRAHQGSLPNVGEIQRIRIPSAEIEGDRRLTSLRERLEARRRGRGAGGDLDLPPLAPAVPRPQAPPRGAHAGAVPLLVLALDGRLPRSPSPPSTSSGGCGGFGGDELILPALLLLDRHRPRDDGHRPRPAARPAALPRLRRGGRCSAPPCCSPPA